MYFSKITLAVALPLALAGPINLETRGLVDGLLSGVGGAAPAPALPVPVPALGTGTGPLPLPISLPIEAPVVGGGLPVPLPVEIPAVLPGVGTGGSGLPLPIPALPVGNDYPDGGSGPIGTPGPVTSPPTIPGGGSGTPGDCSSKYWKGFIDGINLIGKGYGSWPGIPSYPGAGAGGGNDYLAKRVILDHAKLPNLLAGSSILSNNLNGPIANGPIANGLGTNLAGQALQKAPILTGPIANGAFNELLAGLLAKE